MHDLTQLATLIDRGILRPRLHTFNGRRCYATAFANPARTLPWHRINLVITGTIEREISGDRFRQRPGDLVWQFPHTRSRFTFPEPCEFFGLHFNLISDDTGPETAAAAKTVAEINNAYVRLAQVGHLTADFEELCVLYNQERELNAMRARLRLSDLICRIIQEIRYPRVPAALTEHQRETVRDYTHANRSREIHHSEPAALLGYSPDYFSRLFRRSCGAAFRTWQMRERITLAAEALITTNRTIAAIAREHGYPDAAQFSSQFKKVTGTSPRRYRSLLA